MGQQERAYDVVEISGVTDAAGDAVVNSGQKDIFGLVEAVLIEGSAMTDTADLDIDAVYIGADGATEFTDEIVNHEDAGPATLLSIYPRVYVDDVAGADLEAPATYKFVDRHALFGCQLRVTIAGGGNTLAFKVWILIAV